MARPTNKHHRMLIMNQKFKKRVWWAKLWTTGTGLFGYKSSTRPCSCYACKRPRFSRKLKHNEDIENPIFKPKAHW